MARKKKVVGLATDVYILDILTHSQTVKEKKERPKTVSVVTYRFGSGLI